MIPLKAIGLFIGDNKVIAFGAAVILLLMAGAGWLALHDGALIKNHDAVVNLEALKVDKKATAAADEKAADLAIITAQEAAEREKEIDDAIAKFPNEARRAAGPATNAAADSLRARANKGD